jgi:histidyl-tRNA synthetase
MAIRAWLYENMRSVAESFGYQEYEAPLIESIDLYAAKSGDELVKAQSFVFEDRGGNLVTLRPELTPSLVRMVAQRQNQLVFPLRWWSFGPFWRYERPQKGRTREFFQWNIDLLGSSSPAADAELTSIAATFLRNVGLSPTQASILVNNRQLMEGELKRLGIPAGKISDIFRIIDRKDKMRLEEWEAYALQGGLLNEQIVAIIDLLADQELWIKSEELGQFFQAVQALGLAEYIRYDPNIIRGLDYYTGTVFEAQAQTGNLKRAILGGGRYDNLLSDVGGQSVPATGFAMGDVVITLVLQELDLIPGVIQQYPAQVLVTVFDDGTRLQSLELARELRQSGLNVSCYLEEDKLAKQLKYADKIGARVIVLLGPEEIATRSVTLKDLVNRVQKTVPRSNASRVVEQMLETQDILEKPIS